MLEFKVFTFTLPTGSPHSVPVQQEKLNLQRSRASNTETSHQQAESDREVGGAPKGATLQHPET